MTKAEVVNAVAEKLGCTKKDADASLNAVVETIKEALVAGDKIALVGFGTFEVKERAERKGHNPQNGEEITIPASKRPTFKASKTFKEAVNPGK